MHALLWPTYAYLYAVEGNSQACRIRGQVRRLYLLTYTYNVAVHAADPAQLADITLFGFTTAATAHNASFQGQKATGSLKARSASETA